MKEYLCDSCDSYRACKSGIKGRDMDCAAYRPIGEEWEVEAERQRIEESARRTKSMRWTTFQGRKVSLGTIDQQHLSNCYWFGRIIHGLQKDDDHLKRILDELAIRFNGQVLPYRPHSEFKQEIDALDRMGMLRKFCGGDRRSAHVTEIWFDDMKVGEIINPV